MVWSYQIIHDWQKLWLKSLFNINFKTWTYFLCSIVNAITCSNFEFYGSFKKCHKLWMICNAGRQWDDRVILSYVWVVFSIKVERYFNFISIGMWLHFVLCYASLTFSNMMTISLFKIYECIGEFCITDAVIVPDNQCNSVNLKDSL